MKDKYKTTGDPTNNEKLTRMKRWPNLKKVWTGRKVRIWSAEHNAFWCVEGQGYTSDPCQAWLVDFDTAFSRVYHCGPEKQIHFRRILLDEVTTTMRMLC